MQSFYPPIIEFETSALAVAMGNGIPMLWRVHAKHQGEH